MITDTRLRGIALMVASMGAFALADTLVKVSASVLSPAQVLFFLIGGALVLFALMAVLQGDALFDRRVLMPVLLVRYASEVAALGAVVFLGETIGWRRWSCIACGFAGVLLIVQPGAVAFDTSVLWAVLALVSLSVRDLTTRLVPADMASNSLATYTMAAAVPFAIAWVLWRGESLVPAETNWVVVLPMIVLGAIGYMLLIASLRTAEVSVVMPFRFSRVLFLMGLGVLVFDERPDALMLCGALLIIASGSYMMWRDHHVKQVRGGGK